MRQPDCNGKRSYGNVDIAWSCRGSARCCTVDVSWFGQLVMHTGLDANQKVRTFSVSLEDQPDKRIEGEFRYDPANASLTLVYLSTPTQHIVDVQLCPDHPLPPIPPDPEPSDDVTTIAVTDNGSDLFPYVFLRDWPAISAQARLDRFVDYHEQCATAPDALYCHLAAIDRSAADARTQMIAQGLDFIAGKAPYIGAYAPRASDLQGLAGQLVPLSIVYSQQAVLGIDRFIAILVEHLGERWTAIVAQVRDPEFAAQLQRAWQNLFAQDLVLGYDRRAMQEMIRTLTLGTLLTRMVASLPPPPEPPDPPDSELPEPLPPASLWTPERIHEGVRATVVLPSAVFPLPPLQPVSATVVDTPSLIQPYAIGVLQLVRRALIGYEAGEVAHVENVMAGERKVSTQREQTRSREREQHTSATLQSADSSARGRSSSFDEQTQRVLQERYRIDYETTYGPPEEAKATGNWVLSPIDSADGPLPTAQTDDTRSALARDVTTQAARRLSQEVASLRVRESESEREWSQRHSFDRRDASTPLRGIYRWINAVYECWIATLGERFVLELFVRDPARGYIAAQFDLAGVDLAEPHAPATLGVHTLCDISLDPASPLYYARLASMYGYDHFESPPPPTLTTAMTSELGATLTMQVLTLADGYAAKRASVLLRAGDSGLSALGSIGARHFEAKASDTDATAVDLDGQTQALPVAFSIVVPPGTETAPPSFAVTIEVHAELAAFAIDRWKAGFYAGLMTSYRQLQQRYLQAAGVKPAPDSSPNSLATRTLVREELKRAGLREFVRIARVRTGETGRTLRFLPALITWLERHLEWSEMSYSFLIAPDGGDGEGSSTRRIVGENETMTAFLQATHARVLLPVKPGCERVLAYYLATGMLFDGEDTLTPTFDVPIAGEGTQATTWVDLLNDLKTAPLDRAADHAQRAPVRPWKVIVPTTMTLLQDGQDLPGFKRP